MRLTLFTQAFLPIVGGAERFLDQLARRLSARGHEVTVLAARVSHADNRVDAPYRLVRYRKPFSKRVLPRHTVLYLLREHARARPDVVHAQGLFPPGHAVALYCRMTKLPWVVRPLGTDILPGERLRTRFDAIVRRVMCAAPRVVAQSLEVEEIALSMGVPRERIVRIPNGVELGEFAGERAVDPARPVVGSLAMLNGRKGFDVLIDAFRDVRARHPHARLCIAGDGELRAALLEQIRGSGLNGSAELVGLVDGEAKRRFLASLSLFVSAARYETFSNANLEALAAGCPMVATAIGGNREIVREGVNGKLVPAEDARTLGAAISSALDDRARLEAWSRGSRAVAAEYAWGGVVARYESLYAEVAGR